MKILLLCNYDPYNAATVCDHINAFPFYSAHDVVVHSDLVRSGGNLEDDFPLEDFDAVILHYSLFLAVDAYVSQGTRKRLNNYRGVKAIFLQDEYRFVNASVKRIAEVGFDIIFTCVPPSAIERVYPASLLPGVERVNVLTGYVPEALLNYKPKQLAEREIDVSYRGRKYPEWHGRLGQEKWGIAKRFREDARRYKLRCDISYREKDRLYGINWVKLLQNSKAVLGVESGASIFDYTGEISAKVETVVALLGKQAKYEDLRSDYLAEVEDSVPLAQISPRIFEAIALRTLCILYEGEYSGILIPWRHYVPLKKDHSNMDEVVMVLRDHVRVAKIVADAYAEVACNSELSYRAFIGRVDSILEHRVQMVGLNQANKLSAEAIQRMNPVLLIHDPHGLLLPLSRQLWMHYLKPILVRYTPHHIKQLLKRLFGRLH
ncbi:hypothetical protein [Laribacter hongkongensis]|uniref:hypothetical protein n=1 Tax=Laribacter hongkongensis TaxID=168471 RepID=UPI001EFDDAA5|nr:hypothetical protein [Laribacter hongkongensis]MCG9081336.1 hypothetical protein [Laribacter hongkongensis]